MQRLGEMILKYGEGIGDSIVKVDYFLNHRVDCALLWEMADEIKEHFKAKGIDAVLTVEASGIALASFAALALGVPMVFAKKHETKNQSDACLEAKVHSFTHNKDYNIRINAKHLNRGDGILIVDDFLADGEAVRGMRELIRKAGCELKGIAIAIEKGFQKGGKELRAEGVDLLSLAVVEKIENGKISLNPNY